MRKLFVLAGLSMLSLSAMAAGVADIAAGISFTDATAAIVTVMVALGAVFVVILGGKLVLSSLRGR
jgi:hypothetical protein